MRRIRLAPGNMPTQPHIARFPTAERVLAPGGTRYPGAPDGVYDALRHPIRARRRDATTSDLPRASLWQIHPAGVGPVVDAAQTRMVAVAFGGAIGGGDFFGR